MASGGIGACLLILLAALPVHAAPFNFTNPITNPIAIDQATGDVCPLEDSTGNQLLDQNNNPIPKSSGLTRRIVPCIENTILYAASQLLMGISKFMANT